MTLMVKVKECDLAGPVADWLEDRGLRVHAEVPAYGRSVDLIGFGEQLIVCVELKLGLSNGVLYQALGNQTYSHESWCAIRSKPRKDNRCLRWARQYGIGVILVGSVGVEKFIEFDPNKHREPWEPNIANMRHFLELDEPSRVAGMPCQRGVGPAQSVYDRTTKFREKNPDATWATVYKEVPNHYAHPRSMQGAMGVVRDTRERRERISGGNG